MFFPRRKCCVFLKKLLVVFIVACSCVSLLNLLCFDGECGISEEENRALSSLSDVVLEANKLSSIVDRNSQLAEITSSLMPNVNTEDVEPHKKQLDVVKKMKSLHLTSLDFCPKQKDYYRNMTLFVGKKKFGRKRFLSVGIPSIGRKTKSYLKKTLSSIFGVIEEDERSNITVVVFLADFDMNMRKKELSDISKIFKKYISSGALEILQAPLDYYAPLQNLRRSLGDHMDRVLWRSKQALDYVYLMCYCSYISNNYLQLEDDVIASPRFLSKIVDFIDSQKSEWISLNVALLGYIGKLYPVRELQNLASYLRLFFDEMPVDWLEPRWKKYRGQDPGETPCRPASLFQHFGLISSFRPKESQRPNTLKEKFFDQFDQKYTGRNPSAEISSDLVSVHGKPSDAYTRGDGFFRARFGSAGNKKYHIYLKEERKVERIVVETGANTAERDSIVTGTLEVGQMVVEPGQCSEYKRVGQFKFGRIDMSLSGRKIRCVRVNIVYQGRWIFFREIDIWTS